MSPADRMLDAGCAAVEALHGEPVLIIGGPDVGRTFIGVVEIESDQILASELGEDPRGKRIIRFRGVAPQLSSQTRIQTSDGKVWKTVRRPDSAYLTTDFEMIEVAAGKDS